MVRVTQENLLSTPSIAQSTPPRPAHGAICAHSGSSRVCFTFQPCLIQTGSSPATFYCIPFDPQNLRLRVVNSRIPNGGLLTLMKETSDRLDPRGARFLTLAEHWAAKLHHQAKLMLIPFSNTSALTCACLRLIFSFLLYWRLN